jgi:prepilin-type N-terminal cleavage/methylation domain-containing protein
MRSSKVDKPGVSLLEALTATRAPNQGRRAFTLIEIMVAMSILVIVVATVGPTFRKSSISTQGAALTLAAALTEARQQAITQQIPVALVIPSANGTQGQADSYYIAAGEQPRITQVEWFGGEQPDLRFMVGLWTLDDTKLQTSTLLNSVAPPPEAVFESDLDVNLWNLAQPKDFAFIFTPRGKLVTNGLPHFDGAYHILVSYGGQSGAVAAPDASGISNPPNLFEPTEVGSPYTVTIDPAGAVAVTPGVAGAPDGATFIREQALASTAPALATTDAKPTSLPLNAKATLLPNPAILNLPAGADMLLAPGRHLTITTRAKSPENAPLYCEWTADGGGLSAEGPLRMTYLPQSGEWESRWQWRPPADANPGDLFKVEGTVSDSAGNTTPAKFVGGIDQLVVRVGDPKTKVAFHSNRDGNYAVYVMNADVSEQTRLTTNPTLDYEPSWSPDGERIVFASTRDGNSEIYMMNADGSGQTRLTTHPSGDYHPFWSPDGTQIVFESVRDGNAEIYVMSADGLGQTRLTTNTALDRCPSWSPDGRIIFTSKRDGNWELYAMNADGSGQTNLTTDPAFDYGPSWSLDGGKIAFMSDRDGNFEVYVMNADGSGSPTRLTNNPAEDSEPSWSRDGRIAFRTVRHGNWEIYLMNADGTDQTRLTKNSAVDDYPSIR